VTPGRRHESAKLTEQLTCDARPKFQPNPCCSRSRLIRALARVRVIVSASVPAGVPRTCTHKSASSVIHSVGHRVSQGCHHEWHAVIVDSHGSRAVRGEVGNLDNPVNDLWPRSVDLHIHYLVVRVSNLESRRLHMVAGPVAPEDCKRTPVEIDCKSSNINHAAAAVPGIEPSAFGWRLASYLYGNVVNDNWTGVTCSQDKLHLGCNDNPTVLLGPADKRV